MRVFIAISIVAASVSLASAQSATDQGRAADAKAPAAASDAPLLPSQQTNFYVAGASIVKVIARTAGDLKADEAGQAAWAARCRPIVIEDRDGLRRVRYAERDCDLSNYNNAGN